MWAALCAGPAISTGTNERKPTAIFSGVQAKIRVDVPLHNSERRHQRSAAIIGIVLGNDKQSAGTCWY